MPYTDNDKNLPDAVAALSDALRQMWVRVFNSAYEEYDGDESRAAAAAWSAVNNERKMDLPEERALYFGSAVKAIDDSGRIGGYLVKWGSPSERDLQGEYFSKDTDLHLDWYPRRPVLYHHGLDRSLKSQMIGEIVDLVPDDEGLWAEAQLDLRQRYVKRVLELVDKGVMGWSSGSISHLVRLDGQKIVDWPLIEGSLTPTPADPRILASIQPLKSFLEKLSVAEESWTEGQASRQKNDGSVEEPNDSAAKEAAANTEDEEMTKEQALKIAKAILESLGQKASDEELLNLVEPYLKAEDEEEKKPETMAEAEDNAKKMVADITGAIKAWMMEQHEERALNDETERAAKSLHDEVRNRSKAPRGVKAKQDDEREPRFEVRSRFADLSAEDMSFMAASQKMIEGWKPSVEFMRELADKATKGYKSGDIRFPIDSEAQAVKSMREWADMGARKSDELDYSTLSSYGDEWVPTLWSDQLWEKARINNVILPQMRTIEMPSNPFEVPLESTDPTVYLVPETQDEVQMTLSSSQNPMPDSQIGTSKVTLTAKKLALRVGFSSELVEDSIIPIIPQFRKQALRTMQDALDNVLLNADDTSSGNINYNGATAPSTAKYMAFSYGLRHTGLVDNSAANALSGAGNRVTVRKLRELRFLLKDAYAVRPDEVVYVTNAATQATLLDMDEVLTMDKYGPNATILNGQFATFDGSPVLTSAELALSATDGKVSTTAGNNVYGSVVAFHKPSWIVGYRRRIRTNVDYYAPYDAYQMVMTVRLALARRDNDSASVLYYLDV